MSDDNANFKKHVCKFCIETGDNYPGGVKCEMTDQDIDNCLVALDPGND